MEDRLKLQVEDVQLLLRQPSLTAKQVLRMHYERATAKRRSQYPPLMMLRHARRDMPALVREGLHQTSVDSRKRFVGFFSEGKLQSLNRFIGSSPASLTAARRQRESGAGDMRLQNASIERVIMLAASRHLSIRRTLECRVR